MTTDLRVFFEADLVVTVDDYERSEDTNETWDLLRLQSAVQDEIGHTGAVVREVLHWTAP